MSTFILEALGVPSDWVCVSCQTQKTGKSAVVRIEIVRRKDRFAKWMSSLSGGGNFQSQSWRQLNVFGASCVLVVWTKKGEAIEAASWNAPEDKDFSTQMMNFSKHLCSAAVQAEPKRLLTYFGVGIADLQRNGLVGSMPAPAMAAAASAPAAPKAPAPAPVPAQSSAPMSAPEGSISDMLSQALEQGRAASIPSVASPVWQKLITRQHGITLTSLPLKLLLARLSIQVEAKRVSLESAAIELHRFFELKSNSLTNELRQLQSE